MSDPNDHSIPVLQEILVPGKPAGARPESSGDAAPAEQPVAEGGMPREPGFRTEPVLAPESAQAHESAMAPEPVRAHEPAVAPEPPSAAETVHAADPAHAPPPQHPVDHHHPKKRSRMHHAHEDTAAPSAGVFDRAEPLAPREAGTIVPPDVAHEAAAAPHPDLDADLIAERLRGRFAGFLTGEGRGIIEARCRDALQEHTAWLVNQITREVALTLETEMTGWVREAVEEEIARRSDHA